MAFKNNKANKIKVELLRAITNYGRIWKKV
jgi:hypothetical protein